MFEHNIFASDWERFVQVVGFEPTFSASQMRRHAYLPTPNYARRRERFCSDRIPLIRSVSRVGFEPTL